MEQLNTYNLDQHNDKYNQVIEVIAGLKVVDAKRILEDVINNIPNHAILTVQNKDITNIPPA